MISVSNIKAIAIDLDGTTLKSDGTMGELTQDALRSCMARGIQVILCTGRSPIAAEPYRSLLGLTGPMVFYNGAAVIDVPAGNLCAGTLLAPDIVQGCIEISRRRDIHFHAFLSGDRLVYERERAETALYEGRTGLKGTSLNMEELFSSGEGSLKGCIKGMFIADPVILDAIETELDKRFDGRIYRARSHADYLEVMAAGVSKGHGLAVVLQLRGIPPEATIAFGDAENDLPMADVAGFFIAPENAIPPVRQRATSVVASNNNEGPGKYIWQLLQE
ncbi:Cof-type HAD-IIB family hydrolase [Gracilinema caldarium]|uniref:Cof-like hydrolase n=1 Tax=Gracilinema caldarium (strain ATCC 51460 / DSM 7334 / H1) TaxID=744872 RepID=F8F3P5_GRAC1|nr:Cof-type HAD-IIB family hydrolase [Gracilinema caldarium]AEJ19989.1 Cof-like hydrolase [Gracilinema caldarium DSM 7334]